MPRTNPRRQFSDLSPDALMAWCATYGERTYRAKQIRHWLFQKRVSDFAEMHDIPSRLREQLAADFVFFSTKVVGHHVASDGTEKLLLELDDGNHVECVLMREPVIDGVPSDSPDTGECDAPADADQRETQDAERRTVCISTQVGCAMGCVFCASGLLGLKRNLSTGEILEQVLRLDRLLGDGERITNVVVMGIGEPLANLKALLPALDNLHDENGLGLGARRITVSTVGLPEKIREFADVGRPYNLAISLHAPNDALRNELVPANGRIGIDAILQAADKYFDKTGRRVTYEYVLLGGINDFPRHARQLAALLQRRNAHVNLIPMNDVEQLPFHAPAQPRTREFVDILREAGVTATVRKRKGADIDAACGQLRLKREAAALG